jgi:signal transduction histidine kinase/type II secretory pathway pseudopilin PulG
MKPATSKPVPRVLILAVVGMLCVLLALGWWAGESRATNLDAQMRGQLLQQASHVAQTMNPELVRQLSFTAADNGTPSFDYLREQMTVYGHYIDQKSIYSLAIRNDTLVFGPENLDVNDPVASPPGTVYEKPLPGVLELFKTGKSYVIGPYTDDYGTFVSAVAPVTDPQSGKVLMIVGIDVPADDWQSHMDTARWEPFFTVFLLMLVLLVGLIAILWRNRHMKPGTLDLKLWIIVPVALAMLAGLVFFGMYQYQQGVEASNLEMQHVTERAQGEWNRLVASDVQLLKAQIDHVSTDPAMLEAWQEHNLSALTALSQPLSEKLKSDYKITHFYFVEPNRTVFLRAYTPSKVGGIIDRHTMLTAVKTGEDTWGVELGTQGTFTLRYIRPVKLNGTVVGYLELGEEINRLANGIARDLNVDTITVIRKEFMTRENFEAGCQLFGFTGQWDTYPDFVVIHQTTSKIPAEIDKWLNASHPPYDKTPEFTATMDGKKYSTGIIYLPDAAGRNVGDIILMQDVTAQSSKAESDLLFTMGLVIILFGSILVLLWTVTDTAERQLTDAFTQLGGSERAFRQANKKLNLLSSITRHDINNQLTVQMGYLELLEDTQLDPSHNEYFQKVSTAANRIAAMIRFTKEYEDIGVRASFWQDVRTLVRTASADVPLDKICLVNDVPTGTEVFADPMINKVFHNLIQNAVRHGGNITTIHFFIKEHFGVRDIVCEDDGAGIPVDMKDKLFTCGVGKDHGLGLYLSREILAISGITITEEGRPGHGARFVMTKPTGWLRTTRS